MTSWLIRVSLEALVGQKEVLLQSVCTPKSKSWMWQAVLIQLVDEDTAAGHFQTQSKLPCKWLVPAQNGKLRSTIGYEALLSFRLQGPPAAHVLDPTLLLLQQSVTLECQSQNHGMVIQ